MKGAAIMLRIFFSIIVVVALATYCVLATSALCALAQDESVTVTDAEVAVSDAAPVPDPTTDKEFAVSDADPVPDPTTDSEFAVSDADPVPDPTTDKEFAVSDADPVPDPTTDSEFAVSDSKEVTPGAIKLCTIIGCIVLFLIAFSLSGVYTRK